MPAVEFDLSDEAYNFYSPEQIAEMFRSKKPLEMHWMRVRDCRRDKDGKIIEGSVIEAPYAKMLDVQMCAVVIKLLLQRVDDLEARIHRQEMDNPGIIG